eukprot:5787075-Ditylum_brightwellii.AAC.1
MQELADSLIPRPDEHMVDGTTIARTTQSTASALSLFLSPASSFFCQPCDYLQQQQPVTEIHPLATNPDILL